MRPESAEPILPARDLARTRAFYESLGFQAGYHDDRYEILRRGSLVVHLEHTDDLVPERNTFSCYWRVTDVDRMYREFAALGLPSTGLPRLPDPPQDEPWGMREFTLKDPSGNLIRIGQELTAQDPLIHQLNALIQTEAITARLRDIFPGVREQLDASNGPMAWEVVPLTVFRDGLPASVRSCWIFVVRAGASTAAERHPNSHQRSCSLIGSGTFEVYDGTSWRPHALASGAHHELGRRWVGIPPSTWHRLRVGSTEWGMVSFHTVAAGDLIEENALDPDRLDGPTRQQRYEGS